MIVLIMKRTHASHFQINLSLFQPLSFLLIHTIFLQTRMDNLTFLMYDF